MKISDFSKRNNISIDTIRYYIKEHLIHPTKKGSHFYFDEKAQRELDFIIKLKSYKFSLKEIKQIFHTERLSGIEFLDTNTYLKNFYEKKQQEIESEIISLCSIKKELTKELSKISLSYSNNKNNIGLPLDFIQYLNCPLCNNSLPLKSASIINNYIHNGTAVCSCGFKLDIIDSILAPYTVDIDILDPVNNTTITDVLNTPTSFIDFMFTSIEKINKFITVDGLENKIVLDMKCGVGILPLEILKNNNSFKYLILVDEDIEKLKIAKDSIQKIYDNANVVYICCDINNLPIKPNLIDTCIDFNGSFVNGFRVQQNTYTMLLPYMNSKSTIIGLYLYFKSFNMLNRLSPQFRHNFDGKTMFDFLVSKGYIIQQPYTETSITEGSNVMNFFKPNDEVFASLRYYKRYNKMRDC